MDLAILWFILIAVLYIGYFILEGFDFGVGMLMPFLGKKDNERRAILNTIGPHWDGNEVWLLTAGGATFAAFPDWYATLFSGFYIPLFLLLIGLIFRGVAFEFRSLDESKRWRTAWDWIIFGGSLVPSLLLGVAFSNLARGVPIDANMEYVGGFWNLLNPYALLGGVTLVICCLVYGALFLSLKTNGELLKRARAAANKLWLPMVILLVAFIVATYFATDLPLLGVNPGLLPVVAGITALVAGVFIRRKREGLAFVMMALGLASAFATVFLIMYPRVMISSLDPAWSITIHEAASGEMTLRIMTYVALIFVPIVIGYQAWVYWLFRRRVETDPEKLVY